jgi:hypothetical protein
LFEVSDRGIEPVVLEMKPLADAELRRIVAKILQRRLGATVLAYKTHVEVAKI